jgi:hypothetical protein
MAHRIRNSSKNSAAYKITEKTTPQPDTLYEPVAAHVRQSLPPLHRRRVRQVRRV